MHIGIDGYEANVGRRLGIGRFSFELIDALAREVGKRTLGELECTVFLPSPPASDFPNTQSYWKYVVAGPRKLWTYIGLPIAIATSSSKVDVIFSPTHYVPRFISTPRVMAIMDLSYMYYPELFKPKDLYQLVHWTEYSVKKSKHIITISEASKHAIMKTYHVPDSRVSVVYPGLTKPTTMVAFQDIEKKYHISKNYILSVGTIQPRKNYVKLIEAFGIFLQKNKQKFRDVQLVIVGKKGWLYDEILETPKKLGLTESVKFLDFVPDEELPSLYSHALCFALPSLYEGFGLPVLEAMSYKCPVVVSNVSSLPEIAGKAAVYVDPEDVASIATGLLTAVRQRNLMQGKYRIKAGIARAQEFTWENAARQTLAILEQVGRNA